MRLTFETNILVYAADADAGERHVAATDLVRRAVGAVSFLNPFLSRNRKRLESVLPAGE